MHHGYRAQHRQFAPGRREHIIVSGPPHPNIVASTDTRGRFSFQHLRPGRYVLKAYGPLKSEDITMLVQANQPPFVKIWLGKEPAAADQYLMQKENFFEEETGRPAE